MTVKDVPYHVIDTCELEKGITLCQHFDVFRPPSPCSISFRKACLPSHAKFRGGKREICNSDYLPVHEKNDMGHFSRSKTQKRSGQFFATEEGRTIIANAIRGDLTSYDSKQLIVQLLWMGPPHQPFSTYFLAHKIQNLLGAISTACKNLTAVKMSKRSNRFIRFANRPLLRLCTFRRLLCLGLLSFVLVVFRRPPTVFEATCTIVAACRVTTERSNLFELALTSWRHVDYIDEIVIVDWSSPVNIADLIEENLSPILIPRPSKFCVWKRILHGDSQWHITKLFGWFKRHMFSKLTATPW